MRDTPEIITSNVAHAENRRSDDLAAARGIITGVAIGTVFWWVLGLAVWFIF